MLNLFGFVLNLLGLGINFWQYVHGERKHRKEIVSLKEENSGVIQQCRLWTILFGSLALFLFALLLVSSRKTA